MAKLTQAYAYSTEDFFDKKKDDTVVLLTDRPVTDTQLRDGLALRRLAEEGKLCFVQETINSAGPIINRTVGHRAFKMAPSGISTEHVFERTHQGQIISGQVSTWRILQASSGTKYKYAGTFKVPVSPKK